MTDAATFAFLGLFTGLMIVMIVVGLRIADSLSKWGIRQIDRWL